MDRGAWQAIVHGITKSQTIKRKRGASKRNEKTQLSWRRKGKDTSMQMNLSWMSHSLVTLLN